MSVKKKKGPLTLISVICVAALLVGTYFAGYYKGYHDSDKILDIVGEDDEEQTEETKEEEKLSEDVISVLCCGIDNTQKLTDVIMYAQFNVVNKTVDILRIPRDTFVGPDFPSSKINAIYGHPKEGMDGIQTLTSYLRNNWLLDIDYYATIDLEGVKKIVDDMGGITMNIEQEIDYLPGKVLYPGTNTLDGEQAEWILRYRSGYVNGDIGRIDAQTQFLSAAIDRVHELGLVKCTPILAKRYNDINTDMPLNKMISVAKALFDISKEDITMHVVPGEGTMYYSYAVYETDEEELVNILNNNFEMPKKDLTIDDLNVALIHPQQHKPQQKPQNQQSQQKPQYEQPAQPKPQQKPQTNNNQVYQYDSVGRPLYRLDKDGNPIYDYDENGNIVYVYEQVEKGIAAEQPQEAPAEQPEAEEEIKPEQETKPEEEKKPSKPHKVKHKSDKKEVTKDPQTEGKDSARRPAPPAAEDK